VCLSMCHTNGYVFTLPVAPYRGDDCCSTPVYDNTLPYSNVSQFSEAFYSICISWLHAYISVDDSKSLSRLHCNTGLTCKIILSQEPEIILVATA
jgi:hypothetical protein